jgi:hypothetical protein
MARIDRVGHKDHGDAFDLRAGLIGGQRSDAKAVSDLSGWMQGKNQEVNEEALEKGYQQAVARAFVGWERPQDTMQTGNELSESEEVADGVMQCVEDLTTPKSVRDRNRRLSDEARLREEAKQAIKPKSEEQEGEEWEEVADIPDYRDWGRPAGVAPPSKAEIQDRMDALDELNSDGEEEWTD